MRIDHFAIHTQQLEVLKAFYERFFGACSGRRYENERTLFTSYFLRFDSGARLEIMQKASIDQPPPNFEVCGYHHLAFDVGSASDVDALTNKLRKEGYRVASEPRRTGDGYYESVVLDPDGNRVEVVASSYSQMP